MTSLVQVERICDSVAKDLGYSMLKDIQRDVISSLVVGNDVFAVLPTGYVKSLCYACLPSVFNQALGITTSIIIVVTPLISIIKDQVSYILE